VEDNTAFAAASKKAKEFGVPLLVLFVISIGDYKMHDRSTRKIDFTLRNLRWLKVSLYSQLHLSKALHQPYVPSSLFYSFPFTSRFNSLRGIHTLKFLFSPIPQGLTKPPAGTTTSPSASSGFGYLFHNDISQKPG